MSGQEQRWQRRLIEALLFVAEGPLSERDLARHLPLGSDLAACLRDIQAAYAERGVHLVQAGGSWAFVTAPDLADALAHARREEKALSRAAKETLAIIAYHQPVTRAEIEDIRGVQVSRGTLDALFAYGWIAPKGRRLTPGRPLQWGTTDAFLLHFGLASLRDLPDRDDLNAAGLLEKPAAGESDLSAPHASDD
jgi:segregation and condensation protein B